MAAGRHKRLQAQILELDRRIARLAAEHHWKLIDFYTPLADHPSYLGDGVHMKRSGYLVMLVALHHTLPHRLHRN
jgi:hypothetical protein